jgi:hypothetical protein
VKTAQAASFTISAALTLTFTGPVGAIGDAPQVAPGQATAVRTLDSAASTSRPDVVVARDGTVTVVWSRGRQVVARSRVGGSWQPRVAVGHGSSPRVGVDASGSLTLIWLRHLEGLRTTGHGGPTPRAHRRLDGTEGRVRLGARGELGSRGLLAEHRRLRCGCHRGQLAVEPGGLRSRAGAGSLPPVGGPWGPIATLSPPEARNPVSAIDGSGQATVAYVGNRARPRAVTRTQDGWGDPVRLAANGVNAPQLAAGPQGDAVATFAASIDQRYQPQAVTRAPGGTWSGPVSLESPTPPLTVLDPVVGMDASGVATAAWWRSDQSIAVSRHRATRPVCSRGGGPSRSAYPAQAAVPRPRGQPVRHRAADLDPPGFRRVVGERSPAVLRRVDHGSRRVGHRQGMCRG